MSKLNLAIGLYVLGYFVFTTAALFGIYHEWDTAYFIWSSFAHGGVFMWAAIYGIVPKSRRRDVLVVGVLSLTFCIWETIAICYGYDINDSRAVWVEFFVIIGVIMYFMIVEFAKKLKYL